MPHTLLSVQDLLAWVAVVTIILPTYVALKQTDMRYLLTWSGVGQGGYMLLGLLIGSGNGTAGALFHVFAFAATQAAMLMAVFAVCFRTGTAEIDKMGGLATRMPLTVLVLGVGAFSLIGLPPTAGFVSKWLIFQSLWAEGMLLLFAGSAIGAIGTIFCVYRLLGGVFFGGSQGENRDFREAPPSMSAPMLALSLVTVIAGVFPGPVLSWVVAAQTQLELPVVGELLGGIGHLRGSLDMVWIFSGLMVTAGIAALVLFGSGRRQKDTPGHAAFRAIGRVMESLPGDPIVRLERAAASGLEAASRCVHGLYGDANPVLFLLAIAVVVVGWALYA